MVKKLKYPDDFHKCKATKLNDDSIQKLVDSVVKGDAHIVSSGDTLVIRTVEEEGVYETVEICKFVAKSRNIVGRREG